MSKKYLFSVIAGDVGQIVVVDEEVKHVGFGQRRVLTAEEIEEIKQQNRFNRNFPSSWPQSETVECTEIISLKRYGFRLGHNETYDVRETLTQVLDSIHWGKRNFKHPDILARFSYIKGSIVYNLPKAINDRLLSPTEQGTKFEELTEEVAKFLDINPRRWGLAERWRGWQ